ncbi:hypothetical protein KIN20_031659 [Parelaphostrongylus tenuis]|uniref:Uncharacterized protein n=2 Tax=Parelaphostrongylus tenuis TaxID=148309 RepID=A0AAD5WHE2_PARTN|nr:hypothetical protein KIN20_019202 [Parelaphostrongylus tenuis]KAJ1370025.1 hypothetical protein KIN20_031659 [Parelaphostrongylus tenuis]
MTPFSPLLPSMRMQMLGTCSEQLYSSCVKVKEVLNAGLCGETPIIIAFFALFSSKSLPIRVYSDRITAAYRSPIKFEREGQLGSQETSYATSKAFDKQRKLQRTRAADADSGAQPTKWQRRFLVLTRLYSRKIDIPPYVATETMNRMHDRMRVVFIVVGVSVFFTIFFFGEFSTYQRILRAREAGVGVKKM